MVCSGLWAGRGPGTVGAGALFSPSLGTLAHHSTIPVLQGGAPEERLEASDLEAQEVRGQALALLHLLGSEILIHVDAVGSEATGGLESSVLS